MHKMVSIGVLMCVVSGFALPSLHYKMNVSDMDVLQ